MPRSAMTTALALLLACAPAAAAAKIVVRDGESIQAAIDAAPPGATIIVKPGVYRETSATRALTITQAGIHLVGAARRNQPVILQQSGTQTQGIWVSPADSTDPDDPELPPCGMLNERLNGFKLTGFTVQGFAGFGVYLACVDDFSIRRNTASGNLTYAIFPVRSSHGHMALNEVSGTQNDACLYVGQDDTIDVHGNRATDCIIGYEIENSHHVRMIGNVSTDNTAGMLVDIVGNRQVTTISGNVVAGNIIENNNQPNPAPPDQDTAQILPGIGLILEGADETLIARNHFSNNSLAGMTLLNPCTVDPAFCTPPIDFDPNPDLNRVIRNTFEGNTIDVVYLPGSGQGNCFKKNIPTTLHAAGKPLPACR
jgi:nitrous oxidase accessory protein NosD